jgi:RHS repeat-associated protein
LCKLDGAGNRTPEEFHYSFDQQGRLFEATFAQTPSNATPDSSGYYDGYEAQSRARAHYEYDAGGRLYWIGHYWDSLVNGSNYGSQAIVGQSCDYEYSGLNRGVKTDSIYKMPTSAGSASWSASQTDTYGYDSGMDYLTAAGYGDGLANANPTWSYDAAGNRNDAVTDNLNRSTSLGGTTVTSDILGNRLTKGSTSYGWDILNRMTSFTSSGTTSYVYRADGMRVSKSNSTGATSYRYDGQMATEDIDFASNGTVSKVTDYGIGPRGNDAMFVTQSGTTSASYPLYDAHGNMISTLSKQGTGGFAYSALRTFDAWGVIRRGAQTGDPKGRYCASLGHKQDDESGLTYMRARYCEPASGRFLSSDAAVSGRNWFTYCGNDPVNRSDQSGHSFTPDVPLYPWAVWATIAAIGGDFSAVFVAGSATALILGGGSPASISQAIFLAECAVACAGLCYAGNGLDKTHGQAEWGIVGILEGALAFAGKLIATAAGGASVGVKSLAGLACIAAYAYSVYCITEMTSEIIDGALTP